MASAVTRFAEPTDSREFTRRLTALRRRKGFMPRSRSGALAEELRDMLELLDPATTDPRTGIQRLAAFYRADAALFGLCDDSDGIVGDVFRIPASDLFAEFAVRCDDKAWIAEAVFQLLQQDDYGVRDALLRHAGRYLPEATLRALADRMWLAGEAARDAAGTSGDRWRWRHWFSLVEMTAQQLNDPRLFERARRIGDPQLGAAACIEIGRAWLAAGEPATALSWLERTPPGERFMAREREELLLEVYRRLGRHADIEALVWQRFHAHRSAHGLDELLAVIGREHRSRVVADAAKELTATGSFSSSDVEFLLDCDRPREAAAYVVHRHILVDGSWWPALTSLVKRFERAAEPLAATVLYRALLDSILARAETRAYGHGARYLRRLDELAGTVKDWHDVPPHPGYLSGLRDRHRLKRSFWGRYDGAG